MTPLTDGSTMGSAVKGNPESTVRRVAAHQPTDRLAQLRQMHRSRRRNVPAGTRIQRQIGHAEQPICGKPAFQPPRR